MANLSELLKRDLSQVSADELAEAVRQAELVYASAPAWSGRLIAMLHQQGMSWADIVKRTGLAQTTAWRRAEPYL